MHFKNARDLPHRDTGDQFKIGNTYEDVDHTTTKITPYVEMDFYRNKDGTFMSGHDDNTYVKGCGKLISESLDSDVICHTNGYRSGSLREILCLPQKKLLFCDLKESEYHPNQVADSIVSQIEGFQDDIILMLYKHNPYVMEKLTGYKKCFKMCGERDETSLIETILSLPDSFEFICLEYEIISDKVLEVIYSKNITPIAVSWRGFYESLPRLHELFAQNLKYVITNFPHLSLFPK